MQQPIRTALCSFGMSGKVFHAPFIFMLPQFALTGVLERHHREAEKKYPGVKHYDTFEELLAYETIDLVVINTPSVLHFDMARQALLAKKHVVVEKPFTATVAQAQELIALAKQQNKVLSVFQNRRWDSDFLTVKFVLATGKLGQIVDAVFNFDRYVPGLSAKQHKETATPAVGNLYDLGSHLIDQCLQLFGMPNAIFADVTTNREHAVVDDYFDLKLFYKAHRVSLRSSYFVKEPMPGFQIHGKLGSFIKSRADVQEKVLVAGVTPSAVPWGVEPETEHGLLHYMQNDESIKELIPTLPGNYSMFYVQLAAAITNNEPVPVTPQDAANIIKIIEAAMQSHKTGAVVTLNH